MRELTITQAEEIAKIRLDRRRKYATTDDGKPDASTGAVLFCVERWTAHCTGCCDDSEYSNDMIGGGCDECGFTGKRRHAMWLPYFKPERAKR